MRLILFFVVFAGSEAFSLFGSSTAANYSLLCEKGGPFKCSCPNGDDTSLVDCGNKGLRDMPNGVSFPEYVVQVSFRKNKLTAIPNTVFEHGGKVDTLDFSHNLITIVANDAFQGLGVLRELDLSHNDIWTLKPETFHNLPYLENLNLAYNKINSFFPEVFQGCHNLRYLSLKYNSRIFLEHDSFFYLHGLQNLDLSSIGLADLDPAVFANNTELNSLDLTENSFVSVPSKAIFSARSLKVLDLSENPIAKIPARAFLGSNLEVLRLTHMRKLRAIEKYSLTGLHQLKELQITDNIRLTQISQSTFKKFPKPKVEGDAEDSDSEEDEKSPNPFLTKLSLRHNSLQSLSENLMDWEQLADLDLRENPWICDCHLSWVAKKSISKRNKEGAVCASPKRLAGRAQSSLVESDYTCSYLSSEATVSLAVIVVAAFALALVGIGFLLYKRSLIRCGRKRQTEPKYTRVVSTKDKVDLEWDHTGEPPSTSEA